MSKPTILMDTNEAAHPANALLLSYMREYFGQENVVIASLDTDFTVYANGGERPIERKVFPSDFLSSVSDGRLRDQCAILAERSGVLLIEGSWSLTPDGRVVSGNRTREYTYSQVTGILMSIQDEGVKVIWSPHAGCTPMAIHQAHTWFNKTTHNSLHRRPKPTWQWGTPTEADRQLYAIQGFGIGPETAKRALETLGSVRAFLDADEATLKTVPGLGPSRAKAIMKIRGG